MSDLTQQEREEVLAYLDVVKRDLAELYQEFKRRHPKMRSMFSAWHSPSDNTSGVFRTSAGWCEPDGRTTGPGEWEWNKSGREFHTLIQGELIP